jgi:CubicO group peptidase (beta-lactamase class C family)
MIKTPSMRHILLLLLLPLCIQTQAQTPYFPPLEGNTWETTDYTDLGWCEEKVDSLLAFVEERNSRSFIVLKDGKLVLEHYFNGATASDPWYWASAGKSLMAVLVGLAQQDGDLDINSPVANYMGSGWTSAPPDKEALIEVQHLISMSSGLDDGVEDDLTENCFEPDCFQYLTDPDTRWAYHNSPYRYSQNVLETATGINKNLYTLSRLGNRIGMQGAWVDYVFYSTARNMARFGLFMLAEGQWEDDLILSDSDYFQQMITPSQEMNPSYGYLWWLNGQESYQLPGFQFQFDGPLIPEAPADMYAALGKNDQKIYVVPSEGLVVVRQGNAAGGASPAASSFDNLLWEKLSALSCVTSSEETAISTTAYRIFPNPVNEQLQIITEKPIRQWQLLSPIGQRVQQGQTPQCVVSHLPAGLYTLRLEFEDGSWGVERVVVR